MGIFNKQKKDPNVRELSLSAEDIAELSFYTRRMKEIEIDLFLWQDAVKNRKNAIAKRLAIREDEMIDWKHVFIDNKVTIVKIPKPQPIENKQEVNKNG